MAAVLCARGSIFKLFAFMASLSCTAKIISVAMKDFQLGHTCTASPQLNCPEQKVRH